MLCVRMFLAGGLLAATVAAAADGKVVGELLAADASRDQKVIVVLDDAALSPGLARRDAIRALQDRVLQGFDIGRVLNRYQTVNGFSAHMNQGEMMAMAAKGEVLRIEPMPMHQKMDAESLPLTDVDLAQADGFDGTGTVIAIIDDGIDHDHPAFGGEANFPNSKFLGGWDFADNDADPRIDCIAQSHGTAVTGVATGNGAGVTGVAPNAKVVFLKIQSAAICGSNSLDGDIVGALDWIVANKDTYGIDIVSMSFGGGNYSSVASCDGSSVAYLNAVKNAEAAGISMFAASGNSGLCDSISRPACLSPVVSLVRESQQLRIHVPSSCLHGRHARGVRDGGGGQRDRLLQQCIVLGHHGAFHLRDHGRHAERHHRLLRWHVVFDPVYGRRCCDRYSGCRGHHGSRHHAPIARRFGRHCDGPEEWPRLGARQWLERGRCRI